VPAPKEVLKLIERFERNRDAYRSHEYNETQARREFIDPFFKALGWDVTNEKGYAEAYKDVVHEDAIKVGGATKAPDYAFRIGGVRKFFVEAKRPAVKIKENTDAAYQLRRYAWSAKLPLSILTDFEEFAVYDCRIKPAKADKASAARIFYFDYKEYEERWDEISSIFSREAILKGSFDKYAESTRKKRGTATVDDAFLKEIENWRDLFARNIALRNPDLSTRELNYAVQRTIDRIIFLRICEDRGIENYGQLMALQSGTRAYERLCQIFRRADERYNSGLFHFRKEKDRPEPPDGLTLSLTVDDKVLKEVFEDLYYPDSPYEFSVLPADILGHIYEQFLGKIIRLTPGHRAKVEDKPEVKKAGGVYYTPTYIVDYIVKNTVGKLLEGKTPQQASKLRILDPACGSGSFLLGAYQYLLDWHLEWYLKYDPKKHAKGKNPRLYRTIAPSPYGRGQGEGTWRLTTAEKKRILLNNIHGVDIDPQAVEVTKLSLLLKVLEGENEETIGQSLRLFHQRALPDLADNIKCGNSLIGPDFYEGQQLSLIDEEERYRINAFDWNAEFPEIMTAGGFDAVIGNPPWGATFTDEELAHLRQRYAEVVQRMVDSYIYFIDLAIRILRPEGQLGFIVPGTLMNQRDAGKVRQRLLQRGLRVAVYLGEGVFGRGASNTSAIVVSAATASNEATIVGDLSMHREAERPRELRDVSTVRFGEWKQLCQGDPDATYFVSNLAGATLLRRLRSEYEPLKGGLARPIARGVTPDCVRAHVLSDSDREQSAVEEEVLRPSVSGKAISQDGHCKRDQWIVYTAKGTDIDRYPNALGHLNRYRDQISCREVAAGKHPWWALHRPRDPAIFDSPKLIGVTTSTIIRLGLDQDQNLYVTDAMYVLHPKPEIDPASLLAVMESRTFLFLYRVANQSEARVIPQVKAAKLGELPVPLSACSGNGGDKRLRRIARDLLQLRREAAERDRADSQGKERIERLVHSLTNQIDQLVYDLYDLTEEEIKMIEKGESKR